ncbi:uncharacterized protein LOC106014033 [Aplysia californica]|uniref:Uncharacterized protein LOC106014033 n=1 Tax=Aplysia californica TaxID=6500 RepID=A0ABM1AF60_APLCA|nr:uncharacterized protein LOC106014033 [Aplysia californica]
MDVESLISAVLKKPAIWDKRGKDHANRNVVKRAWKDISKELKHDETALKNKWKSLRDYFSTEYNKRLEARSGDAASNQPQSKWLHFSQLLFLKDIVAPRSSFDSLDLDSVEDNPVICHESLPEITTQGSNVESQGPDTFPNPEAPEPGPSQELSPGSSSSQSRPTRGARPRKRSRDSLDNYSELIEIEERKLQYFNQKIENAEQTNDADFLFLKSLYPFMKMVPQHLKLSARNRLQSVLQEFVYPTPTVQRSQPYKDRPQDAD